MKTNLLLVFGGRSSEHEVSMVSAANMADALNPDKYNVHQVYISKKGLWRYADSPIREIDEEKLIATGRAAGILPGQPSPTLFVRNPEQDTWDTYPLDVALIGLHGLYGEDGTIQGLFEMAGLPYVGSTVLGSSACMDKMTTKRVVKDLKIRQADYVAVTGADLKDYSGIQKRVEEKLTYPVYVKPSNAGSSVGVSKAHNAEELMTALQIAAREDSRILIEETIVGREIECAVLGHNETPESSGVGEILAADSFYTYEAKYHNPDSKTVIDPDLPESTIRKIRQDAEAIFRAVGAEGLARVDFFVETATGDVVFNEINTLPGFTPISMYPMLWQARGMDKETLVDRLVELALEKAGRR